MTNADYNSAGKRAFILGLAVAVICAICSAADLPQFFRSYLVAWLFWMGMTLGSFGMLMMHHLVGGRWGFPVRRFFEAGTQTTPLMALCFVPIAFGLHDIYAWSQPLIVHADVVMQRKRAYMNIPFFLIRMVVYFAIWIWLMGTLKKWSLKQDETSDAKPTRELRTFSGPGLVIFFLTATFADIDLVLSLEPDWFSTIFAAILIIGNALGTLAFAVICLSFWGGLPAISRLLDAETWHHLGNLLLAFVMLWAYLAYSQLLIIYSGDLPQEIVWYLHRSHGGWKLYALALGLLHFAVPFALLLSRDNKRSATPLVRIAWVILVGHILDIFWCVAPTFAPHAVALRWQDLALFAAVGAIWIGAYLFNLFRVPLVPLNDPRLPAPQPV